MILTVEQRESLTQAARPLIQWLNENCHPHVTVVVNPSGATLWEGVAHIVVNDYIKD